MSRGAIEMKKVAVGGQVHSDHQIITGKQEWGCSCGEWSAKVPPIGGYGHTTVEARAQQLTYAHRTHVRKNTKMKGGKK